MKGQMCTSGKDEAEVAVAAAPRSQQIWLASSFNRAQFLCVRAWDDGVGQDGKRAYEWKGDEGLLDGARGPWYIAALLRTFRAFYPFY
jgi:hypothetical protein